MTYCTQIGLHTVTNEQNRALYLKLSKCCKDGGRHPCLKTTTIFYSNYSCHFLVSNYTECNYYMTHDDVKSRTGVRIIVQ
uniref:Uncharacterized protein n=1 Tax=Anguilla anguilla TaxID=7936 RepID=A0A0E9VT49_ANGAN